MTDIDLRFHKDMLVLSAPILGELERLGLDIEHNAEFSMLFESDAFEDLYQLEAAAGAQCLVANTAALTPARLARVSMEDRAADLARIALNIVRKFKPQHILVEIGPCGLPLDGSSKTSLRENRDQYARAGCLFADEDIDAFFLNGFKTCDDLKCALMGLRKVDGRPIFASVTVNNDGTLVRGHSTLADAVDVMNEYGASVVGFATSAPQDQVRMHVKDIVDATMLPLLVQLDVRKHDERQNAPTEENPYYVPDTMVEAADVLCAAGVQFLRAIGDVTPAYTGALAATLTGRDVCRDVFEDE